MVEIGSLGGNQVSLGPEGRALKMRLGPSKKRKKGLSAHIHMHTEGKPHEDDTVSGGHLQARKSYLTLSPEFDSA